MERTDAYLVTWTTGDKIRGTRLTPEGVLLDGTSATGGVELVSSAPYDSVTPIVSSLNGDYILMVRHVDVRDKRVRWDAVRFAPKDISTVATLPRLTLLEAPNESVGFIAATSTNGRLILAYDRKSDDSLGGVPRIFTRQFAETTRRRAASR